MTIRRDIIAYLKDNGEENKNVAGAQTRGAVGRVGGILDECRHLLDGRVDVVSSSRLCRHAVYRLMNIHIDTGAVTELTEGVSRGLKSVVQVREDGGEILRLAFDEYAGLSSWSRSRSWESRCNGAECEGGKGSDLHEGEHGDWRGARSGR